MDSTTRNCYPKAYPISTSTPTVEGIFKVNETHMNSTQINVDIHREYAEREKDGVGILADMESLMLSGVDPISTKSIIMRNISESLFHPKRDGSSFSLGTKGVVSSIGSHIRTDWAYYLGPRVGQSTLAPKHDSIGLLTCVNAVVQNVFNESEGVESWRSHLRLSSTKPRPPSPRQSC